MASVVSRESYFETGLDVLSDLGDTCRIGRPHGKSIEDQPVVDLQPRSDVGGLSACNG